MARQEQTDPNQRPGKAEPAPTPSEVRARAERAAAERAAAERTAAERTASERPAGAKRPSSGEEWADEAAHARTASDPRRVTPHDAAGVPSTGDSR